MINYIFTAFKEDYANLFYILTLFLAVLTLFILMKYASDTQIIAMQTQESNVASLRPVVLRVGFLDSFTDLIDKSIIESDLAPVMITLTSKKNISVDIAGYVVVDNRKYELLFGNVISEEETEDGKVIKVAPHWQWLPENGVVSFVLKNDPVESQGFDELYIEYNDIEGNRYYTRETFVDGRLQQTSKLLANAL